MVTEKDSQICLKAYKEGQIDDVLKQVFCKLAIHVFNNKKLFFEHEKTDEMLLEAVELALTKVHRYSNKCKAFNFFTTIICCYIRQSRHVLLKLWRKNE